MRYHKLTGYCHCMVIVLAALVFVPAYPQQTEEQRKNLELSQEMSLTLTRAKAGDSEAQYKVGTYYLNGQIKGIFDTPDLKEAARWFARSAHGGCADGMAAHAGSLIRGFLEKNPKEAIKWYEKAAKKGNVSAYYNLGVCYKDGIGVLADDRKAIEYFRKATDLGSLYATNSLGICYYTGKGTDKDMKEAFRLFRMSAEGGNPAAFANLGRCYMFGQGTEANPDMGLMWYEKAAEAGYADCQFFLGELLYKGSSDTFEDIGIKIDYLKATHYLQRAVDNPRTPDFAKSKAYRLLATCYRFGRGVEADESKSEEYTSKAAEFGNPDARKIQEWLHMKFNITHGNKNH